jgi:cytochrome c
MGTTALWRSGFISASLMAFALFAGPVPWAHAAAGDAQAGKRIFQQRCSGCHGETRGGSTLGPSLVGIVGRKAASGDSGVHSRALTETDITWTEASLRKYLAAPAAQVPGGNMPLAVLHPAELDDVMAYLKSLK